MDVPDGAEWYIAYGAGFAGGIAIAWVFDLMTALIAFVAYWVVVGLLWLYARS